MKALRDGDVHAVSVAFAVALVSARAAQPVTSHLLCPPWLIRVPIEELVVTTIAFNFSIDSGFMAPQLFSYFSGTNSLLSECRNHIPFVLSEVCVFHIFTSWREQSS